MTSAEFDQHIDDAVSSPGLAAIFREAFDTASEPGVHGFSFVTPAGLAHVADLVNRGGSPGILLDAGCGWGGIGLWFAERLSCELIGVDLSPRAVEHAVRRSRDTAVPASFRVGSFASTGLRDAQVGAVVSIDALHFAPDPKAAAAELLRVVRPGGCLVATVWSTETGPDRFTRDYAAILAAAGWSVDLVEEHPEWLAAQLRVYAAATARGEAEKDPAVKRLQAEGAAVTPIISGGRRLLIRAGRPTIPAPRQRR